MGEHGCADPNECLTNNGGCDSSPNATCQNRIGMPPTCGCPNGYSGTGMGENGCTDIDECSSNNGGCDTSPMASCSNTPGSRSCTCPSGYTGNGFGSSGCTAIDACATNNGGCDTSPMATCTTSTSGSAICSCPAGTEGAGIGDQGCERFVVGTEQVRDIDTSLWWQRMPPAIYPGCTDTYHDETGTVGEACIWQGANAYCENLTLGGATDWRLPSVVELLTIVDSSQSDPMIDDYTFPNTKAQHYWTQTGDADTSDDTGAQYVCFCDGVAGEEEVSTPHFVRCVRGPVTTP
jgi:Protein of unknown function (DUF1566)/EGF domain